MNYFDKVKDIIDKYEDGSFQLDEDQIMGMLKAAIDGLDNCDKEQAAREMYEMAGYSLH